MRWKGKSTGAREGRRRGKGAERRRRRWKV